MMGQPITMEPTRLRNVTRRAILERIGRKAGGAPAVTSETNA